MAQQPVVSIIDDDISEREALSTLVRSLGYAARTFDSAESFLDSDCLAETACIVSDVHMPGMSGLDLQDQLRANGNTIPMVVITGFPEEHLRVRAEAGGALGFLPKPFDRHAIARLLVAAVGQ